MFFGQRPDPAQVDAWNRAYLEHARRPDDRSRCKMPGCLGRFPCAFRVEAAELLILAGIGIPHDTGTADPEPAEPAPARRRWRPASRAARRRQAAHPARTSLCVLLTTRPVVQGASPGRYVGPS